MKKLTHMRYVCILTYFQFKEIFLKVNYLIITIKSHTQIYIYIVSLKGCYISILFQIPIVHDCVLASLHYFLTWNPRKNSLHFQLKPSDVFVPVNFPFDQINSIELRQFLSFMNYYFPLFVLLFFKSPLTL